MVVPAIVLERSASLGSFKTPFSPTQGLGTSQTCKHLMLGPRLQGFNPSLSLFPADTAARESSRVDFVVPILKVGKIKTLRKLCKGKDVDKNESSCVVCLSICVCLCMYVCIFVHACVSLYVCVCL